MGFMEFVCVTQKDNLPPVPDNLRQECNHSVTQCINAICRDHGGGVKKRVTRHDVSEPSIERTSHFILLSFCNSFSYDKMNITIARHWRHAHRFINKNDPCNQPPSKVVENLKKVPVKKSVFRDFFHFQMASDAIFRFQGSVIAEAALVSQVSAVASSSTASSAIYAFAPARQIGGGLLFIALESVLGYAENPLPSSSSLPEKVVHGLDQGGKRLEAFSDAINESAYYSKCRYEPDVGCVRKFGIMW